MEILPEFLLEVKKMIICAYLWKKRLNISSFFRKKSHYIIFKAESLYHLYKNA